MQLQQVESSRPRRRLARPARTAMRVLPPHGGGRIWMPPERRVELVGPAGPWAARHAETSIVNPLTIGAKYGYPTLNNGCWYRSDVGVLLQGNLSQIAGGTLSTVIELFGSSSVVTSLTVKVVDVSGGTAPGQFRFSYSTDDGLTYPASQSNILSSATGVPLKGAADGLSINWPIGTPYATDMVYTTRVGGWEDQAGNGNDSLNDDYTNSPTLESNGSYSGIPSIRFNAPPLTANQNLRNITLGPAITGNDVAASFCLVFQVMSSAASNFVFNFGNFSTNAKDFFELQYGNTGIWLYNRTDDASLLRQRWTANTASNLLRHWQQLIFSGTNITVAQDGTSLSLPGGNADLNVGNTILSHLTFGARFGASLTFPLDVRLTEFWMAPGVTFSSPWQAENESYLAARYS